MKSPCFDCANYEETILQILEWPFSELWRLRRFFLRNPSLSCEDWHKRYIVILIIRKSSCANYDNYTTKMVLLIFPCLIIYVDECGSKQFLPSSLHNSPFFTTNAGGPVWNDHSSLTIGSRGKIWLSPY